MITKNNDLEKIEDPIIGRKLVLNLNNIEINDKKELLQLHFFKISNLQWAVIQDQILFHFYLIKLLFHNKAFGEWV